RDAKCTYFNNPWLDFTGRGIMQELGDGWSEGVHPDDLSSCLETYQSSFAGRRAFTTEYRLRRADGEYRWVLDNGTPLYKGGAFEGFIGSCIDVTERKLVEEQVRASERRLLNAQRLARVGSWERYFEAEAIYWSDEMFRILDCRSAPRHTSRHSSRTSILTIGRKSWTPTAKPSRVTSL